MVVPEKENWRHVFDLTRFGNVQAKFQHIPTAGERVIDDKVRNFNDLTRDEMVRKTPLRSSL